MNAAVNAPSYPELLAAVQNEVASALALVAEEEVLALEDAIDQAPRVFCAGRGRSGLVVRAFAMRSMHLGIAVHVVGDTTTPAVERNDLLVVVSGTGTTATLVPIAERAAAAGARRATVTATTDGALAHGADTVVHVPAPPSRQDPGRPGAPVLPMGSCFEMATALLFEALTVRLALRREVGVEAMFARHANLE